MAADEEQFTGDENDQDELGSEDGDGNRKKNRTDKKRKELKQKKEKTS